MNNEQRTTNNDKQSRNIGQKQTILPAKPAQAQEHEQKERPSVRSEGQVED